MPLVQILDPTKIDTNTLSFDPPHIVVLPDGNFVLTYGGGIDVFFTIFDPFGMALSGGGVLLPDNFINFELVSVGVSGGFALAWRENRSDTIYTAVYDEDGDLVTVASPVYADNALDIFPMATSLSNGGYALTWQNYAAGAEIYTAIYNASGQQVAAPINVSSNPDATDYLSPTNGNNAANVVGLPAGGVAFAWTAFESQNTIYTALYSNDGVLISAPLNLTEDLGGDNYVPRIAALSTGGYAVVWQHNLDAIYTAVFDASGDVVSGPTLVHTGSSGEPRIAALADGNYALFWGEVDVYTAIYDEHGQELSAPVNVSNGLGLDTAGDITVLSNGAYALTWLSDFAGVGDDDIEIFTAIYTAAGEEAVGATNVTNSPGVNDVYAATAALADGSYVISWNGGGDPHIAIYQFETGEPSNQTPSAPTSNSVVTDEDMAAALVSVGAADADGDDLSYGLKAGFEPIKGAVSFTAGSFLYTPDPNANGTDSFTILINDGRGGTAEQVVAVTINPRNDPAVIGGTVLRSVAEDSGAGEIASGQLTITDIDGAAQQVFQGGVFAGEYGSLTLTAAGAWTYRLDNDNADVQALDENKTLTDAIAVKSLDGTTKSIAIRINGADENTTRYYLLIDGIDGGSTAEGHEGWFEVSNYDFDVTALSSLGAGGFSVGKPKFAPLTVTLDSDAGLTGLLDPIAGGKSRPGVRLEGVTGDGDTVFGLTLGDVLFTQIGDGAGALDTVSLVYEKVWLDTYTTLENGEAGPVQHFTYDLLTAQEITDPPPVLSPFNILPVADATNTVVTDEDTVSDTVQIGATDADGDTLTYDIKDGFGPAEGSVSFGDGSFAYTPNLNANGVDTFVILIDDGHGGTAEQIVTVTINAINDAPTAPSRNVVVTDEDTISRVAAIGAVDVDGDTLAFRVKGGFAPAKGSVAFVDGGFAYKPSPNATGADSFTILIDDGAGRTAEQVVTVTINPINDAPTAPNTNTGALNEDGAALIAPIGAADVDGDALVYSVKAGTDPTKGSVSFSAGNFIYSPFPNAHGSDAFTILINDGVSAILEQVVTITINPINDKAVIGGVTTGNVTEDSGAGQIASGQLTISDADGASEAAFLPGLIAGTGGFLTLSASGSWSYELDNIIPAVQRLDAGETLIDTVTVRSIDGTTVTIVITINGADEPISNGDAGGLLNGTAGDDLIDAQGGTDVINAGAGNDTVLAGDGLDLVNGGDGNDSITGGNGPDIIHGGNGDDIFIATPGDGDDTYYGENGVDTLDFSAFTTDVEVALGGGKSAGDASGPQVGEDAVSTIENVIGGSGNDNLRGSGGDNRLEGGAGDDLLYGSGGNDILIGGAGDDTLIGSGHDDTFVFGPGFGRDTVDDFDDNGRGSQDILDITAFGITAADFDARVVITDIGDDTRITIDGNSGQTILLSGVRNATRIGIDDFLLA